VLRLQSLKTDGWSMPPVSDYANKETGEEAGPTNMWRIASVSKNITSTTIMKLIEANNLHLTDHVFGPGGLLTSQYPTPASNQKINQITIKYLLEHVSVSAIRAAIPCS